MLQVQGETAKSDTEFEPGEDELVNRDGGQPRQRDIERVLVVQRDAGEGEAEQDEIDRNAEQIPRLDGRQTAGDVDLCGGRHNEDEGKQQSEAETTPDRTRTHTCYHHGLQDHASSAPVVSSNSSSTAKRRGMIFCSNAYWVMSSIGLRSAATPNGWKSMPLGCGGAASLLALSTR